MMLRQIVSMWLRQTARQKLQEVAAEATRGAQYRFGKDAQLRQQMPPCDVVIVFALGVESGGTVDLLRDSVTMRCPSFVEHSGLLEGRRVSVIESGVGSSAAAAAAADIVTLYRPSWLLSAGFAGALRGPLRRGHIVMADEVVDMHGRRLAIGLHVDRASVEAMPSLHVGRLLTVDQLVRTKEERCRLASDHQALACDMETMAVAEVCQQEGVRFLAVRIISDAVDDELPAEIERMLGQTSFAAKLGAAAGAVWGRPSSAKDLWKLKEDALKASDRLARFLAGVVAQLPADPAPPAAD